MNDTQFKIQTVPFYGGLKIECEMKNMREIPQLLIHAFEKDKAFERIIEAAVHGYNIFKQKLNLDPNGLLAHVENNRPLTYDIYCENEHFTFCIDGSVSDLSTVMVVAMLQKDELLQVLKEALRRCNLYPNEMDKIVDDYKKENPG